MIASTIVVMTVLGCADHGEKCDPIPAPERTYTTHAECDAYIPNVLMEVSDAPYPVLTASCETKKVQAETDEIIVARQHDFEVKETAPNTPRPPLEVAENDTASNNSGSVLYRLENGYALVRDETVDFAEKLTDGTARVVGRVGRGAAQTYRGTKEIVVGSTRKVGKRIGKAIDRFGRTIDPRR